MFIFLVLFAISIICYGLGTYHNRLGKYNLTLVEFGLSIISIMGAFFLLKWWWTYLARTDKNTVSRRVRKSGREILTFSQKCAIIIIQWSEKITYKSPNNIGVWPSG